jgi:uncharacterized protein YcbX
MIGTITHLWRYPVKSMAGERLDSALLTRRGIPGDRGWALFDETRNGVTNAKRLPPLRGCAARYDAEPVAGEAPPPATITLPDGTRVTSDSSAAADRLSALVGRAVSLRSLGAAGTEAAGRVTGEGDPPDFVRALFGLAPGEPMPDMSDFTPERLRELRQGNFFDAFPLHVLTRTTLATLERLAPESSWDERRFRANLLVEAEDRDGYPELGWIGRRLRVGGAVLAVVTSCPRCVMVTLAGDSLPHDPRVMRTLVRETAHRAGVYAAVVEEGVVREGDRVELVDA